MERRAESSLGAFGRRWAQFWLAWLAVGVAGEVLALRNRREGDTLSEQVWRVLRLPVVSWLGAAAWLWAGIHWLRRGNWTT